MNKSNLHPFRLSIIVSCLVFSMAFTSGNRPAVMRNNHKGNITVRYFNDTITVAYEDEILDAMIKNGQTYSFVSYRSEGKACVALAAVSDTSYIAEDLQGDTFRITIRQHPSLNTYFTKVTPYKSSYQNDEGRMDSVPLPKVVYEFDKDLNIKKVGRSFMVRYN